MKALATQHARATLPSASVELIAGATTASQKVKFESPPLYPDWFVCMMPLAPSLEDTKGILSEHYRLPPLVVVVEECCAKTPSKSDRAEKGKSQKTLITWDLI